MAKGCIAGLFQCGGWSGRLHRQSVRIRGRGIPAGLRRIARVGERRFRCRKQVWPLRGNLVAEEGKIEQEETERTEEKEFENRNTKLEINSKPKPERL